MKTTDNGLVILSTFTPGHTYEVAVQAVDKHGRPQAIDSSPRAAITIRGRTTQPGVVRLAAVTEGLLSLTLSWMNPIDSDLGKIQIWRSSSNNRDTAVLIDTVTGNSYTDQIGSTGVTYYYWLRPISTSGIAGSWTEAVSGTTTGFPATEIDDFAVDATKVYSNTVVLQPADVWTNNSPGAGSVSWIQHNIAYQGEWYQVAAGSTSSRYIYWNAGNSGGSGTVADPYVTSYASSATYTQAAGRFCIAINMSGIHQPVWNSAANLVIGTAFILDAAVTNAKIASLSADKLTAGTINAAVITISNMSYDDLDDLPSLGDLAFEDAVEYAKLGTTIISGGYLQTALIDADLIQAGTITAITLRTAATGRRMVVDSSTNSLKLYSSDNKLRVAIDDKATSDGYISIFSTVYDSAGTDYMEISSNNIRINHALSSGVVLIGYYGGPSETQGFSLRAGGTFQTTSYIDSASYIDAATGFRVNGVAGIDTTITVYHYTYDDFMGLKVEQTHRDFTVTKGIITAIGDWTNDGYVYEAP